MDDVKTNPYWDNICTIAETQRKKGVQTYGKGIEDNQADIIKRIEYLEEELVDGLMYCEWIKAYLRGEKMEKKRLIEANELLKEARRCRAILASLADIVDIEILVADAPTVDAVEVVHGRWIPTYHTYYNRDGEHQIADEWHCSKCNIYSRDEWNYCPNCGAKMDGDDDDDDK